MKTTFQALNFAKVELNKLDAQLLKRKLRVTESPCDTSAKVGERTLKAFCSNDYLGLANHPTLLRALADGANQYGVGSGASHLISGHHIAHDLLEKKLASFHSAQIPNARALFFSTG